MKHIIYYYESGIYYNLMIKNGEIIKVPDELYDLAIAQGATSPDDAFIELTDDQAEKLGIGYN